MQGRRGASILEVLFAIMVTTIGLLGAVAVFPVAGSYVQKARNSDTMSSAGRAAVHHFDARGMRRAGERWMVANTAAAPPYTAVTVNPAFSYCLDPRFVAANDTTPATRTAARVFPYSATAADPQMPRITLWNGLSGAASGPMNALVANSLFVVDDDLTFVRPGVDDLTGTGYPNDRSLPGLQRFAQSAGGDLTKRQTNGSFSWMATLTPKTDSYILAGASTSELYVLSIVMFHRRPLVDLATDTAGTELYEYTERVLGADMSGGIGDGVGGGTVRLFIGPPVGPPAFDGSLRQAEDYLRARPGDWILLAGQENWGGTPVNRFKWYRVSSADSEPTNLGGGNYELYVSLIGPDWESFVNLSSPRAIVVDGVIGVYEKTIRLETGGAM